MGDGPFRAEVRPGGEPVVVIYGPGDVTVSRSPAEPGQWTPFTYDAYALVRLLNYAYKVGLDTPVPERVVTVELTGREIDEAVEQMLDVEGAPMWLVNKLVAARREGTEEDTGD